ncbi:hypothetical protein SRDD_16770 [Serratia sp. DD3]|nr:hypothetical protein SRDD_45080 [Serratia sp. DD3]KEY56683.1 hypothetical protein SRDD_42720 [Serratia sp. DD3]KEY58383.1 hypothetical protein SRDD_26290 [Serratia sp. DD3]KEY59394.1 hypothetical protein SRDD_16770 [Serratia sp. DD3]
MMIFITAEQKIELERLHDSSKDKLVCDRIKAVPLASEGWSSVMFKLIGYNPCNDRVFPFISVCFWNLTGSQI